MIKLLFRLILLALILLGLGVVFAPNLAATKWGKSVILKLYKTITGNTLNVGALQIDWMGGQVLEGVSFKDKTGQVIFEGKKITTDATLWQIAFYHNFGSMQIDSPKVVFHAELPKKLAWLQAGFVPVLGAIPSQPLYFGHVVVTNGEAQFFSPGFDTIELQNVTLDATLFQSEVKLQGSGLSIQGNVQGKFEIAGQYTSISDIDFSAALENFPVRSIDQLVTLIHPDLKGSVVDAIGNAMTVQLKVKNLPNTLELFCNAKSPTFSAHLETTSQGGIVTLAAPAVFQFQLPNFQGELKIDTLSLPLVDKESFAFQSTLKGNPIQFSWGTIEPFTLFLSTENFKTRNFSLKIDSPQVQLKSTLYLPNDWSQLTWQGQGLFPQNTRVDFSAQTLNTITATVQGDICQGSFYGGYDINQKTLFLSKPSTIFCKLPSYPPYLQQPIPARVVLQPFKLVNLSGTVAAQISLDRFELGQTPIETTSITLNGDLKSRSGQFDIASQVENGSIKANGTFQWPKTVTGQLTLQLVPTSLLDRFLPTLASSIIGETLSGTVHVLPDQYTVQLSSPLMSVNASVQTKNEVITLIKPADLSLNLTPEGYTALEKSLNQSSSFTLTQPTLITSKITSLQWPFNGTDRFYVADFSLDQIKLHVEHLAKNLYNFNVSSGTSLAGSGKLDFEMGKADFDCQLNQFPSDTLDLFLRLFGKSSSRALFGPQINLKASAAFTNWSGPVNLQLHSQNIRASLKGNLNQGILSLSEPLYAQVGLTPELSQMVFNSTFESHDPISLEIPPGGVTLPIVPFKPAQINIPQGHLELGKIYCHNEGNLNITLGLLKLSQYSQNQSLELWFAPLRFQIQQGVIDCERTEVLVAQNYQVCSWGEIDLNQKEVDMVLGLTASCLKKAFGIKDLPENYVLQIPMRGPIDNVKLDTGKATSKIGLLLLWQQKSVAGALGGGPAGAIAGKFLNKVAPLPDIDTKAPPPKKPFPWEQSAPDKKRKVSDQRKHMDPHEQPLKQVLKFLR
jgi:hypothetical protein